MPALSEDDLAPDPLSQFLAWYSEAGTDAVALVTASPDGEPAGRMVLLKGADERGLAIFTNYTSPKALDLTANPQAALLFYWPPDRQVRASGPVTRVDPEESERYWRSRPRGSQLSAWASYQSEVVPNRAFLEARVAELDARFGAEVPSPPFWGGFRLVPHTFEFWQHRDDRLHDRLRYRLAGGRWVIERLSP